MLKYGQPKPRRRVDGDSKSERRVSSFRSYRIRGASYPRVLLPPLIPSACSSIGRREAARLDVFQFLRACRQSRMAMWRVTRRDKNLYGDRVRIDLFNGGEVPQRCADITILGTSPESVASETEECLLMARREGNAGKCDVSSGGAPSTK